MAQKRQRNRRPRPATTDMELDSPSQPLLISNNGSGTTATNPAHNVLPNPQNYAHLQQRSGRSRNWISFVDCLGAFIAVGIVVLFAMLIWEVVIPTEKQRIYTGALAVSLIPVFIAAYTALRPGKPLHQRVTPLALVGAIVGGLFPTWFDAGIAALVLFGFGWVTRPGKMMHNHEGFKSKDSDGGSFDNNNNEDEQEKKKKSTGKMSKQAQYNHGKAALCAILMVVVMLTENFFVWVVSATFEEGWDPKTAPDPLQDNGRRILLSSFRWLDFTRQEVVSMRHVWNIQYALVASLGVALSTADFHPTRQLWSLCCRAILTMTSARFLRTVSFLLTVLPSQSKHCFGAHFPNPPPTEWWDWIMVGMTPRSTGGCNDLIVSGHATVTATMACVSVSFAEDNIFGLAVGWLLAMDYLVEVYEGFHYSVDMWMGAVLCTLLWRVWKPIEDNNTDRNAATLQDMMHRFKTDPMTVKDAVVYGGPVLISYLQVTVFPQFWTNFIILGYTAYCVIEMAMNGFQHYTNHLLFCVLYMALGVYL